jgi:hypothetical protein
MRKYFNKEGQINYRNEKEGGEHLGLNRKAHKISVQGVTTYLSIQS